MLILPPHNDNIQQISKIMGSLGTPIVTTLSVESRKKKREQSLVKVNSENKEI